jgi:hypothetical protein
VNLPSRVFYLPIATINLYGDFAVEQADRAERRDLAALAVRQQAFVDRYTRPHFKNMLGGMAVRLSIPAYTHVVDSYWRIEDARLALIADLTQ